MRQTKNKKNYKWLLSLPLLIISLWSISIAAKEAPFVLLLHSYHQGYSWADGITRGVKKALQESGQTVHLRIEYMDSKQHSVEEVFPALFNLYQKKYEYLQPDLIIVADNNALEFLHLYRSQLFPGVPIVFNGINNFNNDLIKGLEPITGVIEDDDLLSTINIAHRFHPDRNKLIVISDATTTGAQILKRLQNIRKQLPSALSVIELSNLDSRVLARELAALDDSAIILNLSLFNTRDGRTFTLREGVEFIKKYTDAPVYGTWDTFLGSGAVGGKLTSSVRQGEEAVRLALGILGGVPISKLPIVWASPNAYMFDYRELARFDISEDQLPPGSVVDFLPQSFYWKYKLQIWIGSAVLFLLLVMMISLYVLLVYRRRIDEALRNSEARYRNLFEQNMDPVILLNEDGKIFDVNRRAESFFSTEKSSMAGKRLDDFSATSLQTNISASPGTISVYLKQALKGGEFRFEWSTYSDMGHVIDVEVTLSRVALVDGRRYLLAQVRDVNERKQAGLLLSFQRRILELIATGSDLQSVLDALCFEVEKLVPGVVCILHLFNEQTGFLELKAAPNIPVTFGDDMKFMYPEVGTGSAATAFCLDEPVYADDTSKDPHWEHVRGLADTFKVRASWAIPVKSDKGGLLGTLSIIHFKQARPDSYQKRILETATSMAGIAVNRRNVEAHIHHMANHDPLTDLPNRNLLLDHLHMAIMMAKRKEIIGALLFLDLDHFKNINDSLGHALGDHLLKGVAGRLVSVAEKHTTVSRLGGDEFVVLIPNVGNQRHSAGKKVKELADRIRAMLNEPFKVEGRELHVSPSIGVVLFPEDADNPADVLRHADTAMYRAKAAGRNAVQFYLPAMAAEASERLMLEGYLRHAIEFNEMFLLYQPQVNDIGHIVGVEALLRWQHPEMGLIPPTQFIHILEEMGLIMAVGAWVIEQACMQMKRWNTDQRFCDIRHMSVNVSPRQFMQPDFVQQVTASLDQSGMDPAMLTLELTEGIVVTNIENTIEKMLALKKLGVELAIDDFGTGYSSLAYLKRMPLDILKIDKAFVMDLLVDTEDAAIVQTIIAMSEHLSLDVIAEGVETAEQLRFLHNKGCLLYQGEYFSEPLTLDQLSDYIEDTSTREKMAFALK